MPLPTVVVIFADANQLLPEFAALHEVARVVAVDNEEALRTAKHHADIALVWDFRSDLLKRVGAEGLAWVHTNSIGLEPVLTPAVLDGEVVVTNTRGVFEPPMAEWVLAALLFFAKDFRHTIELQRAAIWDHRMAGAIKGRRVVVLGPGGVGREIAVMLRAVGMSVEIVGRRDRTDPELGRVHGNDKLDDLLGDVDDLVVALPLTAATQRILNTERIARMPRGAHLVNVGRGSLVDEHALLEALRSGQIGAAALDVFETEPLPRDHPFWAMENVLVSSHMSGNVYGWHGQSMSLFIDNLARWTRNEPLRDVVDMRGFAGAEPNAASR
jgi:phosphoglycerate dehydrogenase-like enzyme